LFIARRWGGSGNGIPGEVPAEEWSVAVPKSLARHGTSRLVARERQCHFRRSGTESPLPRRIWTWDTWRWWDTGTPTSVLGKRFAQEAQPNLSEDILTAKRLTFAGTDFGPLQFQIWDVSLPPGFDGFIGYNFFAHHIVCMDFPGNRLLIQH